MQAHTTLLPLLPALLNLIWVIQAPSTELNWLLSQPPFFTATHIWPVKASRLSTKSGSTCCNPKLHRHHVQGDILKILVQIICNSSNPVHLFKVKSHADIVGNECADAVAKYQATRVNANLADTGMPCAGINGNPFHDITWLAYERDIPSDATSSRHCNLPAPKLIYFSKLHDALKAHMHSKH